jgi:predicted nucleotide-binding protein
LRYKNITVQRIAVGVQSQDNAPAEYWTPDTDGEALPTGTELLELLKYAQAKLIGRPTYVTVAVLYASATTSRQLNSSIPYKQLSANRLETLLYEVLEKCISETGMTKDKALALLQDLIDQIPKLPRPLDNATHTQWKEEAQVVIKNLFPSDPSHLKKFIDVDYRPIAVTDRTPDSYFHQLYEEGIQSREAMLRAYQTEIRNFWQDPEPAPQQVKLPANATSATMEAKPAHVNRIFIGHGGSLQWRVLKDFLKDRLGLQYEEFNRESQAGIATVERLEAMMESCNFAFLVLTAEDQQADGSLHARENVIHEVGLFQGRYGFKKAIVVLEQGCNEFSNIVGLGQIRFVKGNIGTAFEDVRAVLEREGIIP